MQQRFEAAVYTNDIEACVDALYDGALCTELMTYEPNPEAEGLNAPPLSVAARRGYVRMCKLLLVQGAKIDGVNDFGLDPPPPPHCLSAHSLTEVLYPIWASRWECLSAPPVTTIQSTPRATA